MLHKVEQAKAKLMPNKCEDLPAKDYSLFEVLENVNKKHTHTIGFSDNILENVKFHLSPLNNRASKG